MRLKYHLHHPEKMTSPVEQLVLDPKSRFLEMKSLQPYSTTDEYLYAMKEDLADWLSNMYPEWRPITADNFLECLENGVLLCQHANNVNSAAHRAYSLKITPQPLRTTLENCKYRSDARPQTFNARDNVSQFIKWARRIVGVREVLMFETDDIILRKNEKNFLLCLLEIARYGAQFGVSVPIIIKLEDEIEREIQRDKQTEIMSFTELRRLKREEYQKTTTTPTSPIHAKYSKLLKFVRSDHHESTKNAYNTFSLTHSNGANWLRQRISRIPKFTHHNSKKRLSSEESNESTTYSDVTTTAIMMSNKEQSIPQISRTLGEGENQNQTPVASSQLHKTVVQMTNSCCCDQRFPVIRIGEGKYRIGESGTVIFIRILRYHVMVRVGGGWDTLENYLNKHDPCRRTGGHRRVETHDHHKDIPILPIPTMTIASNGLKITSSGKSNNMKTEDFPLSKTATYDTDLTDAQLVITRDADGRHHIDQITYKSEEDLTQSHTCSHHPKPTSSSSSSSSISKIKSARGTGRFISPTLSLTYQKQSSPSTDQDYSSYTPSSSSDQRNIKPKSCFSEGFIETIDGYLTPTYGESENDFDITDIGEILQANHHDEDHTNMDEDSLESCEGVLETKKKSSPPPPIISNQNLIPTKIRSGGVCTAIYLAQKQRQANLSKKSFSTYSYTRSNTLPNVIEAMKKEEQSTRSQRKPLPISQRSKSTELLNRSLLNDMSKLDRDSGFDEQDFRSERLHSSYDDNSSLSSLKSSHHRSMSSDLNGQTYRENKAYELRLKALDSNRILNEQSTQNSKYKTRQPLVHRYRKNTQPNFYLKH